MAETQTTTAQHSVGEWEYDDGTGQVDVPDGTICVGITWRPNGYLIAAAPELLAALKELVNERSEPGQWTRAMAAIAKAEGR